MKLFLGMSHSNAKPMTQQEFDAVFGSRSPFVWGFYSNLISNISQLRRNEEFFFV